MKLVTFIYKNNTHAGILNKDNSGAIGFQQLDANLPDDMIEFINLGKKGIETAKNAFSKAPVSSLIPQEQFKLIAPIPKPGKIICIGLNYKDHAEETGRPIPEYPTVFTKYNNTVTGPYDPIILPSISKEVDWEGELGFVISKTAKNIPEATAQDYIAGYLACNDVSARDYQFRTSQWTIGKTFDTFAPMGPALVTADEVDSQNLNLKTLIDDEVVQSSNTRHLIFSIPFLIAYLTKVMTLETGDVVITGTPAGVGRARKPPRFLKPGEVVSVEIEGIGTIANPVKAEQV